MSAGVPLFDLKPVMGVDVSSDFITSQEAMHIHDTNLITYNKKPMKLHYSNKSGRMPPVFPTHTNYNFSGCHLTSVVSHQNEKLIVGC